MPFKCFCANPDRARRQHTETTHNYRDNFARDRDRILYSKEFRRLSGKTQVFVAGYDDHFRTRLTHTLEVAQIAKTVALSLGLNTKLCEAIALGHDVGHTPFGHIGERTLNLFMNGCDMFKDFNIDLPQDQLGFKHNWQGLRVVTTLEKLNREYPGLNLTDYTLWGILNHSKLTWDQCDYWVNGKCSIRHLNHTCTKTNHEQQVSFYHQYEDLIKSTSWTFEGIIVRWADEIAQRHHDIEDGIEARIIDKNELMEKFEDTFSVYLTKHHKSIIETIKLENHKNYAVPLISKLLIDFYVSILIDSMTKSLQELKEEFNITDNTIFERLKRDIIKAKAIDLIAYPANFLETDTSMQKYLRDRILNSHLAQSMDGNANYLLRQLIKAYLTNPQQLPDETIYALYSYLLSKSDWDNMKNKSQPEIIGILRNKLNTDHSQNSSAEYKTMLLRTICDYLAGMTDQYAVQRYELLYGINSFGKF